MVVGSLGTVPGNESPPSNDLTPVEPELAPRPLALVALMLRISLNPEHQESHGGPGWCCSSHPVSGCDCDRDNPTSSMDSTPSCDCWSESLRCHCSLLVFAKMFVWPFLSASLAPGKTRRKNRLGEAVGRTSGEAVQSPVAWRRRPHGID